MNLFRPSLTATLSFVPDERFAINASWLLKLRWAAVVGQLFTVWVATLVLDVPIPLPPLLAIIAVTAISNVGLLAWFRWQTPRFAGGELVFYGTWLLGVVMLLDLVLLTALLYFAGGPANPFSIFYLVNLGLAAIVLPARWAWFLNVFAVLCFASLFFAHRPVALLEAADQMADRYPARLSLAQQGLFVAFGTCAAVIVYFVTRLTNELRLREIALRKADLLRARSEKLEALGTLAAGAAHELATPLATIAVVAKEVERQARASGLEGELIPDLALIRSELERCRAILDRMSTDAGQATGEEFHQLTAQALVAATLAGMRRPDLVQVVYAPGAAEQRVFAPLNGLAQAIRGVVNNAQDASLAEQPVEFQVDGDAQSLRLRVRDRGAGMSPEVLAHAGEPFFTTKEPGQGTGLGLFLARSVVERLGGQIELQSSASQGTTVTIRLPRSE